VELIDVNSARAAIAAALGVSFAVPSTARGEADLVIHTSGAPDGLTVALRLAAFEATVVEASWFGSAPVTVPLGEAFHARRLTIRSSQVGHVPPGHRARWTTSRRLALALSLLTDPALDRLITGESPFAELPQMMAQLAAKPGDTLCHRIRY
jgi:threonine dehydrogenase-like Zn-dependent dehydrogenase